MTESNNLTAFLIKSYFWFLAGAFFCLFILFVLCLRDLASEIRGIGRRTLLLLLGVVIFSLGLRFLFSPHFPQVFYDEFHYLAKAENMTLHQKATDFWFSGVEGTRTDFMHFIPPYPPGWPFLLSLAFLLFGIREDTAFNLTAAGSGILPLIVFLASYLLWRREAASLFAALLICCLPVHLKLSACAAQEPSSLFFVFLTLLCFALYMRRKTTRCLFLAVFCLGFTVHLRPENVLLLPLLLLFLLISDRNSRKRIAGSHLWMAAGTILFLLMPAVLVFYAGLFDPLLAFYQGSSQVQDSSLGAGHFLEDILFLAHLPPSSGGRLENFVENVRENSLFFLDNQFHPLLFTIAFIAGLVTLFRKSPGQALFWLMWFVLLSLYYSLYRTLIFSGRFTFNLLPPYLLLSGLGLEFLSLDLFRARPAKALVSCALAIVVLLSPYFFRDFVHSRDQNQLIYEFMRTLRLRVDPNALVITDNKGYCLALYYGAGIVAVTPPLELRKMSPSKRYFVFWEGKSPKIGKSVGLLPVEEFQVLGRIFHLAEIAH